MARSRSTQGFGGRPRTRVDQSAVTDAETDEGTVVLGGQPDEGTSSKKSSRSSGS